MTMFKGEMLTLLLLASILLLHDGKVAVTAFVPSCLHSSSPLLLLRVHQRQPSSELHQTKWSTHGERSTSTTSTTSNSSRSGGVGSVSSTTGRMNKRPSREGYYGAPSRLNGSRNNINNNRTYQQNGPQQMSYNSYGQVSPQQERNYNFPQPHQARNYNAGGQSYRHPQPDPHNPYNTNNMDGSNAHQYSRVNAQQGPRFFNGTPNAQQMNQPMMNQQRYNNNGNNYNRNMGNNNNNGNPNYNPRMPGQRGNSNNGYTQQYAGAGYSPARSGRGGGGNVGGAGYPPARNGRGGGGNVGGGRGTYEGYGPYSNTNNLYPNGGGPIGPNTNNNNNAPPNGDPYTNRGGSPYSKPYGPNPLYTNNNIMANNNMANNNMANNNNNMNNNQYGSSYNESLRQRQQENMYAQSSNKSFNDYYPRVNVQQRRRHTGYSNNKGYQQHQQQQQPPNQPYPPQQQYQQKQQQVNNPTNQNQQFQRETHYSHYTSPQTYSDYQQQIQNRQDEEMPPMQVNRKSNQYYYQQSGYQSGRSNPSSSSIPNPNPNPNPNSTNGPIPNMGTNSMPPPNNGPNGTNMNQQGPPPPPPGSPNYAPYGPPPPPGSPNAYGQGPGPHPNMPGPGPGPGPDQGPGPNPNMSGRFESEIRSEYGPQQPGMYPPPPPPPPGMNHMGDMNQMYPPPPPGFIQDQYSGNVWDPSDFPNYTPPSPPPPPPSTHSSYETSSNRTVVLRFVHEGRDFEELYSSTGTTSSSGKGAIRPLKETDETTMKDIVKELQKKDGGNDAFQFTFEEMQGISSGKMQICFSVVGMDMDEDDDINYNDYFMPIIDDNAGSDGRKDVIPKSIFQDFVIADLLALVKSKKKGISSSTSGSDAVTEIKVVISCCPALDINTPQSNTFDIFEGETK